MMKKILLVLLLFASPLRAQTIDHLVPGSSLTGTETLPMFQTANPAVTTTPAQLWTYINSQIASIAISTPMIDLAGNINFGAGTNNGPANSSIYNSITASGVCTDPSQTCYLNQFIAADNVDASAASNGLTGWFFSDQVGASSAKGRAAMMVEEYITAVPAAKGQNYTALASIAHTNVNLGTTSIFGFNSTCQIGASATVGQCVGSEIDMKELTGATNNDLIGQQIVLLSTHAQAASLENVGLAVTSQANSTPMFDTLFQDGTRTGFPGSDSTTTIFKCLPHPGGSGFCPTIANGIDMTAYAAITGAPILAPLATPASSSATCKQGAMEWDASFVYVCTATNTWKRATLATF